MSLGGWLCSFRCSRPGPWMLGAAEEGWCREHAPRAARETFDANGECRYRCRSLATWEAPEGYRCDGHVETGGAYVRARVLDGAVGGLLAQRVLVGSCS